MRKVVGRSVFYVLSEVSSPTYQTLDKLIPFIFRNNLLKPIIIFKQFTFANTAFLRSPHIFLRLFATSPSVLRTSLSLWHGKKKMN